MSDPGYRPSDGLRSPTATSSTILAERYRCRMGEIDLVIQDRDFIVMLEIRLRKQLDSAGYSIDWHKRQKLKRCAEHWLATHPQFNQKLIRFDALLLQQTAGTTGIAGLHRLLIWTTDA